MGVLRIAGTFAAAAVAFSGYAAYRRRHVLRGHGALTRTPEPLQRWEGEGGAVPTAMRPETGRETLSEDVPGANAAGVGNS